MLNILNTLPEAPLDGIGATPRNNEMGKKFSLSDMNLPNKYKVSLSLMLEPTGSCWIQFGLEFQVELESGTNLESQIELN